MKYHITIILLLVVSSCSAQAGTNIAENKQTANADRQSILTKSVWFHGSPDCKNNKQPENDIYRHSEKTFIIRQNKCSTFEAPFIYVLVGADKVLVLDTGAIGNNPDYSLSSVVENLLGKDQFSSKEILVLHSHGHSDHLQGDSSFEELPNVKLIKPSETGKYLGFTEWPQGLATLELGDRQLKVIPTPGHQEEAITIYDPKTKWLLTGDTLYPGYIYIKDWESYKYSIDKLASFSTNNDVTAIMGAHIEMKNQPSSYYPIGTIYQPNEAQLDLTVASLHRLNTKLKDNDKPTEIILDDFIIKPMNGIQKTLSNVVRWFSQ